METPLLLENIKSPTDFEKIASSYLAAHYPALRKLIHTGLNAKSRAINSPVDGLVIDSEEKVISLIQHTTYEVKSLGRKWFSTNEKDPGDLMKAYGYATGFSGFKAVVYLVTNRLVGPELVNRAKKEGAVLGVDVEVVENSQIVRFLDEDIRGQQIRKRYLGVPVTLIGPGEINDLGLKTAQEVARRLEIAPDLWVRREFEEDIHIRFQKCGTSFIVGGPDAGKTISAISILTDHLVSGEPGLIIFDAHLKSSETLEEALKKTVKSINPDTDYSLFSSYAEIEDGNPILIVVDGDLDDRYNLRKAMGWARDQSITAHFLITISEEQLNYLVPLFPGEFGKSVFRLGELRQIDAVEIIQSKALRASSEKSLYEAAMVAIGLENDHVLAATWELEDGSGSPEKTIRRHLARTFNDFCSVFLPPTEFSGFLEQLAFILKEKKKSSFGRGELDALISRTGVDRKAIDKILVENSLFSRSNDYSLMFRSKAVQRYFLMMYIRRKLGHKKFILTFLKDEENVEIVAYALSTCEDTEIVRGLTESDAHLSVKILRYSQVGSTPLILAADKVRRALTSEGFGQLDKLISGVNAIDSPIMDSVLAGLEHIRELDDCRLLNGMKVVGNSFIQKNLRECDVYDPSMVLNHAYTKHKDKIDQEIDLEMSRGNINAYLAAGLCEREGSLSHYQNALSSRVSDDDFSVMLWSLLRCCGEHDLALVRQYVDELIRRWRRNKDGMAFSDLRNAMRWPITYWGANHLIKLSTNEEREFVIALILLNYVNSSAVQAHVLHATTENRRFKSKASDRYWPETPWVNSAFSEKVKQKLFELIRDSDSRIDLAMNAFCRINASLTSSESDDLASSQFWAKVPEQEIERLDRAMATWRSTEGRV